MSRDQDTALVERCLKGDQGAFESLLDRHEKAIYNAAFRMLNDREDARDVTQTVFMKALEHLDRFDGKRRFFSWIYRIAINESIDTLKRRGRLEPGSASDREVEATGTEVGEQLDQDAVCAKVQGALMTLRTEERATIVLKHFLGCSYREMSQVLEVPEKTVKSRLFVARRHLKDALGLERP